MAGLASCISKNWKKYASCSVFEKDDAPEQQQSNAQFSPEEQTSPFAVCWHIKENSEVNNTSEFEICENNENLVVRRGNKICLSLRYDHGLC